MEGILIMSKKEVDRLTKDHAFRKMNQRLKEDKRRNFLRVSIRVTPVGLRPASVTLMQ